MEMTLAERLAAKQPFRGFFSQLVPLVGTFCFIDDYVVVTAGFIGDLCCRQNMLDHLILQHRRLDAGHEFTVAVVVFHHLLRLFISGGELFHHGAHLRRVHLNIVLFNDLPDNQSEGHPTLRFFFKHGVGQQGFDIKILLLAAKTLHHLVAQHIDFTGD